MIGLTAAAQGALEQAMLANPELAALHPELKLKADKARSNSGTPVSAPLL